MADDRQPDAGDLDTVLYEASQLVQEAYDASIRARDYMGFVGDTSEATLQDFMEDVYAQLDVYCSASRALKILDALNTYSRLDDEFLDKLKDRYGKISKTYETFKRYAFEISANDVQDIWALKNVSHDAFVDVLELASKEHQDLIPKPTIAHLALLRFYVVSLLDRMEESDEAFMPDQAEVAYVVYAIGAAMKSMESCWQTTDQKSLERMLSMGMSERRKRIHADKFGDKYVAATEAAKGAWNHGCQLLHSQMLLLLQKRTPLLDDLEEAQAKSKLRDAAPASLKFGTGTKKILDACPCEKREGCPLASQYGFAKKVPLPTSTRAKRSKA